MISLYTDGSCGRTGNGGWSFIVVEDEKLIDFFCGTKKNVTNNRMELLAVIKSFEYAIKKGLPLIEIVTDSQYCRKGVDVWLANWKRNSWLSASGNPIKNQSEWRRVDRLLKVYKGSYSIRWVKGHTNLQTPDAVFNRLADNLAKGKF